MRRLPLKRWLNLHDFEAIAQRVLHGGDKKEAWDYYSSGADGKLTYNENVSAFQVFGLNSNFGRREGSRH